MKRLVIDVAAEDYAVATLDPQANVPGELLASSADGLVSITRTPTVLSLVCPADRAPRGVQVEAGWRLLSVRGPLAFTLTGIIAAVADALAAAGVTLFAMCTFDTDHVLVRAVDLSRAVAALRDAGHEVRLPG